MKTKLKKSVLSLAVASFATSAGADSAEVLYDLPVLPAGPQTQPVDGRPTLTHDNAAIAASFNAKNRKAPLDVGHLTEWDGAAPAVGWVVELYVAEDGSLWARCDMTVDGQALIDGKKFGYTSPTLRIVETESGWTVMSLKSLALTNNPALEMSATFTADAEADDEDQDEADATTAAATAETTTEVPAAEAESTEATEATSTTEQAQATEVPDAAAFRALQTATTSLTAERDAAQAEVTALSAQVATFTEQLTALAAERDSAQAEVATFTEKVQALEQRATTAEAEFSRLQAEIAESAVVAAVDAALTAGHFTVTVRDTLLKQARNDLAGFNQLVASMRPNPAFAAVSIHGTEAETFGLTHEQLMHCKRAGISPASYAAALAELSN